MLNFNPIELEDKKEIDNCLEHNTYRACDYCFTNLYAWQKVFQTNFAIFQKTLFVRYKDRDKNFYYMMPIGKMDLTQSISLLLEDAEKKNCRFAMKGITVRMWNDINSVFPDKFDYQHDLNNDEYIYLSEKLISLKGKKLQSKRNHINRFKTENPNWMYFPLTTEEDFARCTEMHKLWDAKKEDTTPDNFMSDLFATQLMLDNFHALQLKGGAVEVNGKIIAFSIGEMLNSDTFVVHVEKAFSEIQGAYAIINQQFVEHEGAEFKYINREEDLGIEALRKAKHSYQPEILLEERILTLKKNSL